MATPRARAWRAAFGSLRDSTVTSSSPSLLHALQYVLSQTKVLVSAAPDLSTQEVAADIMLLVELTSSERWLFEGIDRGNIVDCVCHLVARGERDGEMKPHGMIAGTSGSTVKQRQVAINVSKSQKIENKLEVQILVFIAIGNVFARAGSAVSKEMWQSAIEALRKVMDFLASKSQLVEDNSMSRYYAALLRCLHLVLSDPKGSLREHVPGFVAALRMFFTYGLTSNLSIFPVNIGNRVKGSCGQKSDLGIGRELATHKGSDSGPYRPPHLRGKTRTAPAHTRTNGEDSRLVQPEASGTWAFSSDSELSDGDGSSKDRDFYRISKVLDEYLRAVSGFKGTDDLLDDGPLNPAFVSVLPRPVRSLSVHSTYRTKGTEGCEAGAPGKTPGSSQWLEALNTHLPPTLVHPAPMVRAAALTCFAGSTSSVFFSLPDSKQTFIISSIIKAASKDEIPSVRSAACRAIGVIASFPQISASKNRLEELVNVVISNTLDTSVSVRITASWALANICDSLRHNAGSMNAEKCPMVDSPPISLLAECALRLSKDGDKVQWNVCHALGNLFLNESVRLKDMTWAPSVYSILLLLLRDSSNFKIRIHAASALAVPSTREDYGNSFADVAQALGHTLETLDSDQDMAPSSFKYRKTLAEQLTSTTLHIFGLAVPEDNTSLNDFLIKRASFLEEWLRATYSSLMKDATHADVQSNGAAKEGFGEKDRETITMNGNYCLGYCTSYSEQQISSQNQPPNNCREDDVAASLREELMRKKESILRATRALINMYHCANQQSIIPKFEHLISQIS